MSDGHDSAFEQDFESDSWRPLKRPVDKPRRTSVKGSEQARPSRRPGDLKLPSRNQPPPALFNQFAHPLPRDDTRRLHSTTSLQSFPKHSSLTDVMSGRVRSGSLGLQADPSSLGSRSLLIDVVQPKPSPREFSVAVVGTPGCGKSTFIAEDARAQGARNISALSMPGNPPPRFRYTRKVDSSMLIVHEFDITTITTPPLVDGIIVCYDYGDASSFSPIPNFLQLISAMKCSKITVALKSDLEAAIDPKEVIGLLDKYHVGLVLVDNSGDAGRMKMRKVFNFFFKSLQAPNANLRNPASPEAATAPVLWESRGSVSGSQSPSPVISTDTTSQDHANSLRLSSTPTLPTSPPPSNSPSRARSTSDLHLEREKIKTRESEDRKLSNARSINNLPSASSFQSGPPLLLQPELTNGHEDEERRLSKEKETRSAQYATLEELLDKLLFLAVSGDDPTFISHFLLTYRRFAMPRSILLAMQKRMRQLDNSLGDPMLASFAQMRICHLLETWMHNYPQDFAVPGAAGALNAIVNSLVNKTYLLHYGCDFKPFLEYISNLVDTDATWAQKTEPLLDENEDPYLFSDGEDLSFVATTVGSASASRSSVAPSNENAVSSSSRERKQSLPLSAKALIMPTSAQMADVPEVPPKQLLKELSKQAQELQTYDCAEIAEEITRNEAVLFMEIQPRHWLRYAFVPGRKDPESDTIARFNAMSNYLADWVASLILCHDKPKNRARQIEKFVGIAHKLRALNNYSALRAFVAGINTSTFQGDETMEQFKTKAPDHYKNLLSWDVLLQHRGAHQAYRMALKNTKGACIPALEVHISDLIRAHEGNPDFSPSEPNKIHWGKFNMLGRFIQTTMQCQIQCQTTSDYNFLERHKIRDLVFSESIMSEGMQVSRMAPVPESILDEPLKPTLPRTFPRDDTHLTQGFRRIFQR